MGAERGVGGSGRKSGGCVSSVSGSQGRRERISLSIPALQCTHSEINAELQFKFVVRSKACFSHALRVTNGEERMKEILASAKASA